MKKEYFPWFLEEIPRAATDIDFKIENPQEKLI